MESLIHTADMLEKSIRHRREAQAEAERVRKTSSGNAPSRKEEMLLEGLGSGELDPAGEAPVEGTPRVYPTSPAEYEKEFGAVYSDAPSGVSEYAEAQSALDYAAMLGLDPQTMESLEASKESAQALAGEHFRRAGEIKQEGIGEALRVNRITGEKVRVAEELHQANEARAEIKRDQDLIEATKRAEENQIISSVAEELEDTRNKIRDYRIDPNRYYKNTMASVGSAIAMAIGAYAQGLAAGQGIRIPNTAKELFEAAINRDILAQEKEFESLKATAAETSNVFSKWMRVFNDRSLARTAAKIAALDAADVKIMKILGTQENQNIRHAASKQMEDNKNARRQLIHQARVNALTANNAQRTLQLRISSKRKDIKVAKWVSDMIGGHASFMAQAEAIAEGNEALRDAIVSGGDWGSMAVRYVLSAFPETENNENAEFRRESAMLMVELMHAVSGAAVTDKEREIWMKKFGAMAQDGYPVRQKKLKAIMKKQLVPAAARFKSQDIRIRNYLVAQNPSIAHLNLSNDQIDAWLNRFLGIGTLGGESMKTPTKKERQGLLKTGKKGFWSDPEKRRSYEEFSGGPFN